MKTRLNKRREVYKNAFGRKKEKRHRARRFNVKHVSGAQLTGTRAHGEERCQAASPIAGWFAPPGNPTRAGAVSGLEARAPQPAAEPCAQGEARAQGKAQRATLRWPSPLPGRVCLHALKE